MRENFDIFHLLPDPTFVLAQDLPWVKATRHKQGAARGLFYRSSECLRDHPEATKANLRGGYYHGIHEIEEQVKQAYGVITSMTGFGLGALG